MTENSVKITAEGDIEFIFAGNKILFKPNLQNISKLETEAGCLWQLVENIEANKISCQDLVRIYKSLSVNLEEDAIFTEIKNKGIVHYMLILLQILTPIITGFEKMGAKDGLGKS